MVNEHLERIKRMRNDYNNWRLNNNTEGNEWGDWDEDTREDGDDWDGYEEYGEMSGAHVSDCAATIADAYRTGRYEHMWEALAEATDNNGDSHSELTHNIMWETISELGWDQYPMSRDVFSNDTFKRMVTETCGGLRITPLSTLLTFLTESTDDETNIASENRTTVIGRVAHTLLSINPTIHDHAVSSLAVRLPYSRQHYIEQYILGAPRGENNALAEVGRQALQDETRPGRAFRYARQFAPEPTIMQEMADAAAWWRSEITRAEQAGDSDGGEVFVRRAHAHAALALMHGGSLPHSDLATLIETLQELKAENGYAERISVTTCDWTRGPYNKITLTGVGALIDEAASRMETR